NPTLTLVPILVRTKQERELRCVALRNDVPVGAEGLLVPPAGVERAGGGRGRVLVWQVRASIRALEQGSVSLGLPPPPGQRPPPPPPALYLLPGAYFTPPPARGRTARAFGHRRVGGTLPSCGGQTPFPTLPGGGSFRSPSSGKAGSMRSRRLPIAIIPPRS